MKALALGSPYRMYIFEPYQTVPSIFEREPNRIGFPMLALDNVRFENYTSRTESLYPARKINRPVPYREYVRLALDTIEREREPSRIEGGKVRYGTVRYG